MNRSLGIVELFEAAQAARANAHAPYSSFPVGAALRTGDGRVFAGCNVENAAYPVGSCAEAGAIAAMVAAGARLIAEILVVGASEAPLAPCGACRQRILEFSDGHTRVHLGGAGGEVRTLRLAELLPEAFGSATLKAPRAGSR